MAGSRVIVNGIAYSSIKEACDAYNLSYGTIQNYMHNHYVGPSEAILASITGGIYKNQSTSITINGIQYGSIKECCRRLGISYNTVMKLKREHNVSADRVIYYIINNTR